MAGNSGGPWGGGGGNGRDSGKEGGRKQPTGGKNKPEGSNPVPPEIDDMLRKGQEQLRVLMGGRGSGGSNGSGRGSSGGGLGRSGYFLIVAGLVVFWLFNSLYQVQNYEKSVELFFGRYVETGEEGLNFAPWPVVRAEVVPVDREQTEDIGVGIRGGDAGLMLTGDENIVDIDFSVFWVIKDASSFLFKIQYPERTIKAVSESAMREVVGNSDIQPILTGARQKTENDVRALMQSTLDSYGSGIEIREVKMQKVDPPSAVIDAFRDVQAARADQERARNEANAYANKIVPEAQGEASKILRESEAYQSQTVAEAEGQATRFVSIYSEYIQAKDVTRQRMFLETMEKVFGSMNKIIVDNDSVGGQGVVPYLPLNEINKKGQR